MTGINHGHVKFCPRQEYAGNVPPSYCMVTSEIGGLRLGAISFLSSNLLLPQTVFSRLGKEREIPFV